MSTQNVRAADIRHWQNLTFRDVGVMTTWLAAIGVVEHAVHRSESDPDVIVHGEWVWPGGAGFMGGSFQQGSVSTPPGSTSVYLVTDDVAGVVARAVAAGGTIVVPLEEKEYGGRGATVQDPEGNHWSFGSYQPS